MLCARCSPSDRAPFEVVVYRLTPVDRIPVLPAFGAQVADERVAETYIWAPETISFVRFVNLG